MTQKTKYLYENKEIAEVLSQGFAKICHQKPQFPINYLARFLKNYTINNKQKTSLIDKLQHSKSIQQHLKQLALQIQNQKLSQISANQKIQQQKQLFLNKISTQKQPESIINQFCQWITQKLKFTAVYVGELQYQTKNIDLMNQDSDDAHLEIEKQKIVRFKYASQKQHNIIVGQNLSLQSVVGKLLTQSPQSQPQQGQNEEQQSQEKRKAQNGSVYLESVVGNNELKFFTYPKLGAYFATCMSIKSELNDKLIDENMGKVESYHKLFAEYEKEIEERELKFREAYEQKAHSGADQKQLQAMEEQFERQKSQSPKPSMQPFTSIERKFVVCADTLSQDREISVEERRQLMEMVNHLKTSWERQQHEQVQSDIEKQFALFLVSHQDGNESQVPNFQQQLTALFEEEEKELLSHEEVQKVKDNQKLVELQMNSLRFDKTKQYLSEQKYLKFWDHLLSLNVVKYQQVVKQFLVLLGYEKAQFSLPHTNVLDWLKTKHLLNNSKTLIHQKLQNLTPRGSKPQQLLPYAKCSRIAKNLDSLEVLSLANYNIYLALILRLLQLYVKTRQQDRQARVTKISAQRQLRQLKLKQAEEKQNVKRQKLETLKAQLQEKGQLETFDEQAWSSQYDEENPPVEVPDEVADDIDEDLADGDQNEEIKNGE